MTYRKAQWHSNDKEYDSKGQRQRSAPAIRRRKGSAQGALRIMPRRPTVVEEPYCDKEQPWYR